MNNNPKIRELQREFMNLMFSIGKLNLAKLTPEVSRSEFGTLKVIYMLSEKREPRVSDVVKLLKVPAPAVSRQLKTLESKGFIERDVDKEDRRNTFVKLTKDGEMIFGQTTEILEDFADSVFGTMGEDSLQQMNNFFRELLKTAQDELDRRVKEKGETRNGENI